MKTVNPKIHWVKASFTSEKDAFLRVVGDFTPACPIVERRVLMRQNSQYLQMQYGRSNVQPLIDAVWRNLENTDSWLTVTPRDIMKAIERNRSTSGDRDPSAIIDEFNTGTVRAPIILKYGNRRYTLVAGNTRLMVARSSKIIPKVVFIDTDW